MLNSEQKTLDEMSFREKLFDLLAKDAGLQEFADASRGYLGNPVVITDSNIQPLAYSHDPGISDSFWRVFISNDVKAHANVARLSRTLDMPIQVSHERPFIIQGATPEHRTIDDYVVYEGKMLALVQVLEYYRDFTDDDFTAISYLDLALKVRLRNLGSNGSEPPASSELLLTHILESPRLEPTLLAQTGLETAPGDHYLLYIIDYRAKPFYMMLTRGYLERVSSAMPSAMSAIYENRAVLLLKRPAGFEFKTGTVYPQLMSVLEEDDLVCGIAKPFSDLVDIHKAYEQAVQTLELSRRLYPGQRIVFFDDIAPFLPFEYLPESSAGFDFCDGRTTFLLDYDATYGTQCFRDLVVYIFNNCNVTEAAAAFGIHRNTMYYRIDKIEKLMGCSFANSGTVHTLRCSIDLLHHHYGTEFASHFDIPEGTLEHGLFNPS